ncbi:MAG: iron chelate uptake ABC transporter family permease subunit, partial [Chitinophagales bacterium]|nr:iron chelate uptake ABC transporter family permease subunit [Chitinophagales bacterium]
LRKTRWLLILVAGLLTGTITAFCGPIAFIGIAVPHVARLIFRTTDHRILIPGSMLAGVCIMLLCDMLSQAPGFEFVLPVNSITAIMGAPMVIWLLFRNNNLRQYF